MHIRSLFFLALLLSCGGVEKRQTNTQELSPNWIRNPYSSFSRETHITAVGSCGKEVVLSERCQCAADRALEKAVLSVRSNVTAVRDNRCIKTSNKTTDYNGNKIGSAAISCETIAAGRAEAELGVVDTQPAEQHWVSEECFVLVALDRSVLAKRVEAKLKPIETDFNEKLSGAEKGGVLLGLSLIEQSEQLLPKLHDLSDLMLAIQDRGIRVDYSDLLYAVKKKIIDEVDVCLLASDETYKPEQVFTNLSDYLAQSGIQKISMKADGCDTALLKITFTYLSENVRGADESSKSISKGLETLELSGILTLEEGRINLKKEARVFGRGIAKNIDLARGYALGHLSEQLVFQTKYLVTGQK